MAANDLAKAERSPIIRKEHMQKAYEKHVPMELQEVKRELERFDPYKSIYRKGYVIGSVNGLAVSIPPTAEALGIGNVVPVEVALVRKPHTYEPRIYLPEKFEKIAKDSAYNALTIFKAIVGEDAYNFDYKVNFVQSYSEIDGDSATIAMLAAMLSSYAEVPIDQSIAVTGSLRLNGEVLAVGGIRAKIEAAKREGLKKVIIPYSNKNDANVEGIEVLYGKKLSDYLIKHGLLKFDDRNPRHKELKYKILKFEERILYAE